MTENLENNIKEELSNWNELNDKVINIIPSKDISFKTRSLLSQILSRLELTNQDRLDLEKYITFGGGENLELIKSSLEIFIEYKDKILNIIKDAPEEFDTLIEIFNYIEQHIQDTPFEIGDVEHSAVLKGGNNEVTNANEVALGEYNKSNNDTLFSIGIGTSDTDRKNAFEVKHNGDIYIEGVEGKIQDKLNGGSSATPDWNANEGEPGFIKNRTHYAGAKVIYGEEKIEEPEYSVGLSIPYYDGIEKDKFYIEYNICEWGYGAEDLEIINQFNGITEFDANTNLSLLEVFDNQGWDTQGVIRNRDGSFYIQVSNGSDGFAGTIKVYKIGDIKQLGEEYIPNTIARKSDIIVDPVVWKYICNPLIIEEGMEVPDELYDEDRDWLKYEYPAMYRFYDDIEFKFCVKANYNKLTDSKKQDWYINMKTFYFE